MCMCLAVLAACSSTKERQDRALSLVGSVLHSQSGAIQEVRETSEGAVTFTQSLVQNLKDSYEHIKRRVSAVQAGIEQIQEGGEKIKSGLGTGSADLVL